MSFESLYESASLYAARDILRVLTDPKIYILLGAALIFEIVVQFMMVQRLKGAGGRIFIPFAGRWLYFSLGGCGGLYLTTVIMTVSTFLLALVIPDYTVRGVLLVIALIVDLILMIVTAIRFPIVCAHNFRRSGGFAAGLFFLPVIFRAILAFSPIPGTETPVSAPEAVPVRTPAAHIAPAAPAARIAPAAPVAPVEPSTRVAPAPAAPAPVAPAAPAAPLPKAQSAESVSAEIYTRHRRSGTAAPAPEDGWACPCCGRTNAAAYRFCGGCGSPKA